MSVCSKCYGVIKMIDSRFHAKLSMNELKHFHSKLILYLKTFECCFTTSKYQYMCILQSKFSKEIAGFTFSIIVRNSVR